MSIVAILRALIVVLLPTWGLTQELEKIKVNLLVYDISADRAVDQTSVAIVVYRDCASQSAIFRTSVLTGEQGEAQTYLPVGAHVISFAAPGMRLARGCIGISSKKEIGRCSVRPPTAPQAVQLLIVRTLSGVGEYPPDVILNHPRMQIIQTVCNPLNLPVPDITSKRLLVVNDADLPLANTELEFRENARGVGQLIGSVLTDGNGVANLSQIYRALDAKGDLASLEKIRKFTPAAMLTVRVNGSSLRMTPNPTESVQRIKVVKRRCNGHEQSQWTSAR